MARRESIKSDSGCLTVKRGRTTISIIQKENYSQRKTQSRGRAIKFLRICLIFFYGQFFATAIYTHLIHNIALVLRKSYDFYAHLKVALGLFMIIHTFFATFFTWKKNWRLIFASVVSLILLSTITLVTAIIDLVQRKERKLLHETEFGSIAAEITVEGLLRIVAVFGSLLMVKRIRQREGFDSLEVKEDIGDNESGEGADNFIRIEEICD